MIFYVDCIESEELDGVCMRCFRLNPQVDDMQRLRVEKMERQLANLTGLVQKALQVPGPSTAPAVAPRQEFPPAFPARPPVAGRYSPAVTPKGSRPDD